MLKKETIQELGPIMKKKFNVDLSPNDLEKFAYSLVGYFSLLLKAEIREKNKAKFGNSSAVRIDSRVDNEDNDEVKK